ncbi:hypothetical protein SAMN05421640_1489 [Ekhidna lutea]|uniref:Uncharacterized protein n=1 Tax=Ekhidna lutea TaxID=447679 RepID=A0A239HTF6_EKHLU|nr:hypothetical protein [Ekhidna lutea]SNS84552.1 hypothetical protein SAMN05421640_1489 [Ekhidna lutea]
MEELNIINEAYINQKNKYEESIKTFADKLEEKINFLKEKASDVEQSARVTYENRVDLLKQKKDEALDHYQKIRETSESKWSEVKGEASAKINDLKDETETAYTGIKNGFSYLFDKFKS